MLKEEIRTIVESVYDYQKLRIMVGNRINAIMRNKFNSEEDNETKIINEILKEFTNMQKEIDKLKVKPQTYLKKNNNNHITNMFEYKLIEQYNELYDMEKESIKVLKTFIEKHPLNNFFSNISGLGPLMGGVIIAYFDPYKARHCSSFWSYAGLDVVNGEGRSRKKDHLVDKKVINSEGNITDFKALSFNPELKTKLIGVLGSCLLKKDNKYRDIYYDYKERKTQENEVKNLGRTKSHIHNMSVRYMIKMLLRDLWIEWRTIEGLPVTEPYEVAKLHMKPHGYNY